MKRTLTLLLCLVMAVSALAPTALAAAEAPPVDGRIEPLRYQYITYDIGTVTLKDGTATCNTYAYLCDNHTCAIYMYLQRYSGGWSTIASASTYGTGYAYMTKYWSISSGYYYRLIYYVLVKDSSGNILEYSYNVTPYKYY